MNDCVFHGTHCYWLDDGRCGHCADEQNKRLAPESFLGLVRTEIRRARTKHATNIHNVMEGYAVIYEELCEFWEECRKQNDKRDPAEMLKELVQVAAMCMRTAEDCNLISE